MPAEPVVGRTFGRVAAEYERARPEYPPEAIDRAAAELGLAPEATVLDLAAGTGKLTRALAARFETVIAVEPDDGMRAFIDGDARAGTAEAIPVEDAAVDAVFVGDALHWFDIPVALAEMRRVVRPGGGLAILFNKWHRSSSPPLGPEASALLDEVWQRFGSERANVGDQVLQYVEDEVGPLGLAAFVTELRYSGARYAELCITASTPARLPDTERGELQRELRERMADEYVLTVPTELRWVRAIRAAA